MCLLAALVLGAVGCAVSSQATQPETGAFQADTVYAAEGVAEPPRPEAGMQGMMAGLRYPDKARDAKQQGRVFVEFVVSEDGDVRDVRVMRSSGHDLLDREAARLVEQTEFQPGRIDGRGVAVRMVLPINFRLR